MGMGKQSRRSRVGKKRKGKDKAKNKAMRNLEQSERIVETRIARDQAKLAEIRAKKNSKTPARGSKRARVEPDSEPKTKLARTKEDEADQRFAIRYYYRKLDSPPEEDWDGYCGTVSEIRRLMLLILLGRRLYGVRLSASCRTTWISLCARIMGACASSRTRKMSLLV